MNIARLHILIQSQKVFIVFTWFTRILLALAFIPSGIKKLLGLRFTALGVENPVGFLFEALYRTGVYWNFLGAVQITAAICLLIPRTSFIGAIIYFPVVVNICIIVTAMNFVGTPIITALMLLGNVYLFFWHYPQTKTLINSITLKP